MVEKYAYLINSCDSYSDLWTPLFKLISKYNSNYGGNYYLNTESKSFAWPGLKVQCLHGVSLPWGARLRSALEQIDEEYIVFFLDDFFLRAPVNSRIIDQCVANMELDRSIACFYFLDTGVQFKSNYVIDNQYPEFLLSKRGKPYILNCQAGIWRKDLLMSVVKSSDTPWSFELLGSKDAPEQYKFYFLRSDAPRVYDYGNQLDGEWGVVQGKWCVRNVEDLFKNNDIHIDYSKRGIYKKREGIEHIKYSVKMKINIFIQWWKYYK